MKNAVTFENLCQVGGANPLHCVHACVLNGFPAFYTVLRIYHRLLYCKYIQCTNQQGICNSLEIPFEPLCIFNCTIETGRCTVCNFKTPRLHVGRGQLSIHQVDKVRCNLIQPATTPPPVQPLLANCSPVCQPPRLFNSRE